MPHQRLAARIPELLVAKARLKLLDLRPFGRFLTGTPDGENRHRDACEHKGPSQADGCEPEEGYGYQPDAEYCINP